MTVTVAREAVEKAVKALDKRPMDLVLQQRVFKARRALAEAQRKAEREGQQRLLEVTT